MKKLITFIILLLFGIYTFILYSRNQLGLYIHPRFFEESLFAAILAIAVGIIGLALNLKSLKFKKEVDKKVLLIVLTIFLGIFINPLFYIISMILVFATFKSSGFDSLLKNNILSICIVAIILALGFILPAKGLSSITADQRSIDLNSINLTQDTSALSNFNKSTSSYSIGDWIASLTYNPDLNFYKGKDVDVVGFVYSPESQKLAPDEFLVSRFIITCCAVDARPVGLKVKYDWQSNNFKVDDWVEVKGRFDINNDGLIIVPTEVKATQQPSNPYIY